MKDFPNGSGDYLNDTGRGRQLQTWFPKRQRKQWDRKPINPEFENYSIFQFVEGNIKTVQATKKESYGSGPGCGVGNCPWSAKL